MNELQNGLDLFWSGNYTTALKLLKPLAQQGNPEAQCVVANIYHLGLGVDKNGAEAVKWYLKSAQQGYGVASNNLAGIYSIGDCGVPVNQKEAAKWNKISKEQGFPHAPNLNIYEIERIP